ncbi:ABC transporter permease [Helicobacter aurati]|uniref:ABC transporter permease n=1 Tax=Helicobacter aurati TaxID=137778 RepID=A0A3D8J603_9HELI|nr:ABC transporter permease [Helicobacter aurati]RDU72690.1 ABC transporter permease [Helicobacter aurati]
MQFFKARLYNILVLCIVLLLWDFFSTGKFFDISFFQTNHIIPSPFEVWLYLQEVVANHKLFLHIQASLYRYILGFAIGAILGIVAGFILSFFSRVRDAIDPLIQILRPISPIAWFPLIVIIFGIGDKPAIYIIAYAVFFPMLLLTLTSIKQIDSIYYQAMENLGAGNMDIFLHVTLPASFIGISSALKLGASLAWINLVVGEMVGAQNGLGYLIIDSRNLLQTEGIIASMLCIGCIGYCINLGFESFERFIQKKLGGK